MKSTPLQGVCYIGLQLMNDLTQLPQQLKNFSASHRSRAAGKQRNGGLVVVIYMDN
jgi:hypothetical protein